VRAILFASATIATFLGRRDSTPLSHGSSSRSARLCAADTVRAPWISSVLKYGSPRLLIPSSLTRPPVPDCCGTRPRKAANSRPERKLRASATVATLVQVVSRQCIRPTGRGFALLVALMELQEEHRRRHAPGAASGYPR